MSNGEKPNVTDLAHKTTGWQPRTLRLGRCLFAVTRAVTGEWAIKGKVRRCALIRGQDYTGWHLIVGPWCLSVGRA